MECQFSPTASSRHHNYTLLRPRDKQVALKADESYIRFNPRLLFMFISPSITRCPGMQLQNHTCSPWTTWLFTPQSTNMFYQSGSINTLSTFFFRQSNSITTLLTDPCSYLHGSQLLAVTLPILREIFRKVRRSAGPSPVRALSSVFWRHHFMSRSGRQRNHCCLVGLIFSWTFCQDDRKGWPSLGEYNVLFYDARHDHSVCRCWRT
jgi:hypothetical protein